MNSLFFALAMTAPAPHLCICASALIDSLRATLAEKPRPAVKTVCRKRKLTRKQLKRRAVQGGHRVNPEVSILVQSRHHGG